MRKFSILFLALITGCASNIPGVRTEVVPTDQLELSHPSVHQEDEGVEITGNVSRKSNSTSPIAGHVDITITNAKGEVTDEIPASLTPSEIPNRGQGHSTYKILLNRKLEKGFAVRVEFSDQDHFSPYGSKPVSYGERARAEAVGGLGRSSSSHSPSRGSGSMRGH